MSAAEVSDTYDNRKQNMIVRSTDHNGRLDTAWLKAAEILSSWKLQPVVNQSERRRSRVRVPVEAEFSSTSQQSFILTRYQLGNEQCI